MPVSPGASGMQPRDPCRPWRGTFPGRLAVGVGDGLLQIVLAHVLARVHIDDGEGLGPVDDQIPAGLEPNLAGDQSLFSTEFSY